jgi:hypothetical protein
VRVQLAVCDSDPGYAVCAASARGKKLNAQKEMRKTYISRRPS